MVICLIIWRFLKSRGARARKEVAEELAHTDLYMRRYGVQQALLPVPLAIPVLAVVQEAEKHTAERFPSGKEFRDPAATDYITGLALRKL
jgi:hypothetical protein